MGDGQDGARVGGQVLLQPLHALGVQVVGRLVQQEEIGPGQQQPAERDPAPLPAGQAVTSASPAGSRRASMAISSWASRSQALAASMASWTLAYSSMSRSISSGPAWPRAGSAPRTGPAGPGFRRRPPRRCRARPWPGPAPAPGAGCPRWPRGPGRPPVGDRLQPGHDLEHGRLAGPWARPRRSWPRAGTPGSRRRESACPGAPCAPAASRRCTWSRRAFYEPSANHPQEGSHAPGAGAGRLGAGGRGGGGAAGGAAAVRHHQPARQRGRGGGLPGRHPPPGRWSRRCCRRRRGGPTWSPACPGAAGTRPRCCSTATSTWSRPRPDAGGTHRSRARSTTASSGAGARST